MIYDQFQEEANSYVKQGYSVIVSAPTGSGKTVIAEYVISDCIKKDRQAIYTAPIKALSNQKFRDFRAQYKERIGIITGDVSINPSAPVLIMTTEILRNRLLTERSKFKSVQWVIFDEVHYLDDFERGTVWEESLIFLPQHINILCLSATIPNIEELKSWIESVHKRPLKIVKEDKRPVPLEFGFQCSNQILSDPYDLKKFGFSDKTYLYKDRIYKEHISLRPNKLSKLINYIQDQNHLPCIYFSFSRRRCEDLAFELYSYLACRQTGLACRQTGLACRQTSNFLDNREKEEILSLYESLVGAFQLEKESSCYRIKPLIQKGIAYHHAGLLPPLKEIVERLFVSRLLKVIFTTETFALGVNMPARSVIFDELGKFYGRYYRTLKTRDFYQMAGRAGRRRMDLKGFVYSRINPHRIDFEDIKRVIFGKPERVSSKFNTSYATILNLYRDLKEDLLNVYQKTFHYFQSNTKERKEQALLLERKLQLLKKLNYISEGRLTKKGEFASYLYGYELPLTEIYNQGFLDKLNSIESNIVISSLVFEPRKGQPLPPLSKTCKRIKIDLEKVIGFIHNLERRYKIWPLSKNFYFHITPLIEAYTKGEDFSKISDLTNIDEGELVRFFRMTIQILREIYSCPLIKDNLKEVISKSIDSINRDIVDAERQLQQNMHSPPFLLRSETMQ